MVIGFWHSMNIKCQSKEMNKKKLNEDDGKKQQN